MKILDLNEDYKQSYFLCLEDWSEEMQEAGNRKELWYNKMKDKGLRVKIAVNTEGNSVGMIQYIPIEQSSVSGKDLYFINCIWVHGYEGKGVGNNQNRGIGKSLLNAAENDVKSIGAKGIVAWGVSLPFWMKASWFKKQGYIKTDKDSLMTLLWKPFSEDAKPPKWIRKKRDPDIVSGKITITSFVSGWCPAQNLVYERAKKAASEFKDNVIFREIDTSNRKIFLEWGISDALYIDKKQLRTGPPPSYEKIVKKISKKLKSLK
ncbi:MAG: GNAT family N-acetyltransferase [Candidatus Hermodarchaeota archaeon]